jgi:hypothetical protein
MSKTKEILTFLGLFAIFYVLFNWKDITRIESVESVCQETSEILSRNLGKGFTDVAYLNCINQGLERAKQDQEAIINALGNYD